MTASPSDPVRWERIRSLFGEAQELEPRERAAWLEEAAGGDEALLAEVRSLLEHGDADRADEERPVAGAPSGPGAPAMLPPGHPERIGPYRILLLLGEGGMGAVYEAEQSNPRRLVALKVLRVALASDEVRRRFAQEGEVLGRLRHPAVAQVYEMGAATLAAGVEVPYLAMEHVRGARTLTQFVREESPSREALLELFCAVVDGVEHAHQQGIVHRDLKPANILVDSEGRPKVIDFGLARAVGEDSDLASMHTRTGQVMGTPTYMSPEQFAGDPRAIGLATDIYSLGVLLFELISGRLPHDLDGLSIADMAQAVRDKPPRRLAESTGTRLHDDLDTIVGKALEKQPERRYETAAALAADVRRYLRKEPILARPASVVYRSLLFARRHRVLVAGVAAMLLVAIVAAGVSLRFAFDARRHAEEADRAAYIARILGAESAIGGQHFSEASDLLAATPEHLRGWEYRHLASRLDRTLPLPAHADWLLSGIRGTGDAARTVVQREREDGGSEFVVVEVESGAERLVVPGEARSEAVLSPDGAALAILRRGADEELTVVVWDVASGREQCGTNTVKDGDVQEALRWNPSGDRFLLLTSRRLLIYAAGTGALLASREGSYGRAAWTADGRWIVGWGRGEEGVGNDYGAYLLDAVSLERRPGFLPIEPPVELVPAPSGTQVAVVRTKRPSSLLQVSDGRLSLVQSLVTDGEPSWACAWSPDGRQFAAGLTDGHIRVWEAATGKVQDDFAPNRLEGDSSVTELAFLPGSGDLLTWSSAGGTRVWPVGRHLPDVLTGHKSYIYPVSLSADGSLLLSGGWDGSVGSPGCVKLWDARTGTLIAEYGRIGERCEAGALTPDGRHAVIGAVGGPLIAPRLEVIDLLEGRVRTIVPRMDGAWMSAHACKGRLALHPDGRRLFLAGRIWDLFTGECLTPGPPDEDDGRFSPDGRLLATWDLERKRVHIEELASRNEVCSWSDADKAAGAWSSYFSSDSRWLISPWADGTVSIRDATTGGLIAQLPDTGAEVMVAATSPDGTRIATGGRDTIVRLWDTTHFDLVAQLAGHERYVFGLMWSPDGEQLYSGSGDGTVRIWDTRTLPEQIAARQVRDAAMPAIERSVGRALTDPADPQRALAAVLDADDLDTRGRQLAAQAAMAFLVPRAEAQQYRATEGPNGPLPGDPTPRGPSWIRAPRAATPPVIDGRLDDADWARAPWTNTFVDIEGPVKPPPRYSTRAKLLWDDEFLYVAASLEEPHVHATLTTRDEIVFHDNDFEVFVDPDGDGRWYGEVEVNALGTLFDLRLSRADRERGQADHDWSPPGLRAAVAVDGTLNDPSDIDRGWTVEIAIPHTALADHGSGALPPRQGDVWRVNFSRVQWQHEVADGRYVRLPDTREDNWVWTAQYAVDMHRPEQWGFVELMGHDG